VERTWHVLDRGARSPERLTVVCVHGNPTWSYLWRSVVASAPDDVRVVAVDHLDMGYSERTGTVRRLADRIDDLESVIDALDISTPIVTVAHDWGGPISLGWVLRHRDQVRGVVLLNTSVHQPADADFPAIIAAARLAPIRHANTVATPAFVRGTTALSGRRMDADVASAFAAPYRGRSRRAAVGAFVADIPVEPAHPSRPTLDAVAAGVTDLAVPALLLWGPGDPVFGDRYLRDLLARMPHADVHRYEGARHLVIEDAPALSGDLWQWIEDLDAPRPAARPSSPAAPIGDRLAERARRTPMDDAVVEWRGSSWRRVSWGQLARTVDRLAAGLQARGVARGDRVAVLIPPGADLIAVVYACWRIGAVIVVTDAGLGVRGIHRALRGAGPRHVIGIPRALALVRTLRLPGTRIRVADLPAIARLGDHRPPVPDAVAPQDDAAVVFTSGSTGPAKGVVYTHERLAATRDLLAGHYGFTDADALVAAFAPWAVLGPALGIASVLPDMDVTSPSTLRAAALADAIAAVGGTVMWASPAALRAVLASSAGLTPAQVRSFRSLRLVLGAGAPVPAATLDGIARLCPEADVRTPYGMTEALPVTDVTLEEIVAAGPGPGVLVGRPLPGLRVAVSAVDDHGQATGAPTTSAGVLGEVLVGGPHLKDRYDRLWATERASARDAGWHRTGDVGSLDDEGRLWIGGRLAHVITTPDGPVAPVGLEQRVETLPDVDHAAVVGVGPVGTQAIVVIVVPANRTSGPAGLDLIDRIRAAVPEPVAAVLLRRDLPVDIRHQSKVDRRALAAWADAVLAGHRDGAS
jgi:acyl-coenzyme A synthetase/AMP-(fatty) acid ligase/pimeloyl-ACP methyl ester carboxylesterase